MTELRIDPDSTVPPFEQLKQGVLAAARAGELSAGEKLPTVRALADRLGLAPNTVARAYRQLEELGAIETRGRAGSFVSWSPDAAESELERAATEYAARARALGVPVGRARAIMERNLRG